MSVLSTGDLPSLENNVITESVIPKRESILAALWDLYELTWRLRKECPWDRKQTQESIVPYTLEETYELIDAVRERENQGGSEAVRSELGDLLYQVYFLSCVAEEEGWYDLGQVAAGIHEKLVRRHPHVFGDVKADTSDEVKKNWEIIKRKAEARVGIFHDVPVAFSSLLFAQKLQQRAAAVGFDWDKPFPVMDKLKEEMAEIEQELLGGGSQERVAAEVGDLLFAVVNLARKLKADPEVALRASAMRFRERVESAASLAIEEGLEFEKLDLEQQELYYQRAKKGLGNDNNS